MPTQPPRPAETAPPGDPDRRGGMNPKVDPGARHSIAQVRTDSDIAAAIDLGWRFFEHVKSFPGMADKVESYLAHHRVAEKFAAFDEHFLPPTGDCLLARGADDAPLGVVMLTTKSPERCEMNRMYVAETARGTGLGRALCIAVINRAREMGFSEMTLDTLKILKPAIHLYRAMGFEDDPAPDRFQADDPRVLNLRRSLTEPA